MSYPHETKECQPFQVKVNKIKVLTGVEVVLLPPGDRPALDAAWGQPVILDGELCVSVDELAPESSWNVWARVTSTTTNEIPIIYCGNFEVT